MKAWRVHELGDPADVLGLEDSEEPVAGPGEALIEVGATSLNFFDILLCQGTYQEKPPLPFTPGAEVGGTVLAVGDGVDLAVGQRVVASPPLPRGGLARRVVAPRAAVFAIPDAMPFDKAAAHFIVYQTAYFALHRRAGLQSGEVVLVHAGAGGVGSAAVQIAKAAGCRVIATAGSAAKVAACRALGADEALDYSDAGWVDALRALVGRDGIDIVYDPVGGPVAEPSLRAIAWHGRYLVVGFAGGAIPALAANRLLLREASAIGVLWGEARRHDPALSERVGERVLALYRQGAVPPLIGARFPLDQAPAALARLAGRATSGKVLITVSA